jgi:thioesterase domain-containing protein
MLRELASRQTGRQTRAVYRYDTLQELERSMLEGIPIARAMQLHVLEYDGHRLALSAPLAPNVNDKGCAFGGSLVSLTTLAAWGLINLRLGEAGAVADVYVQDSNVEYLAPVWGELVAEACAGPDESWQEFIAMLSDQGTARIRMAAEVSGAEGGQVALRFSARFVAKRRKH